MADSLDRNHCSCNAIVVLIRHHPFDALVNLQGGRQTAGSRTLLCSRGHCQAPEEGRALGTTPPFPIPLVLLIVPSRASLGHNSLPKGHQLEHPVSSMTTSLPPLVPTGPLPSGPMGPAEGCRSQDCPLTSSMKATRASRLAIHCRSRSSSGGNLLQLSSRVISKQLV